jgi:hypothetical protein
MERVLAFTWQTAKKQISHSTRKKGGKGKKMGHIWHIKT